MSLISLGCTTLYHATTLFRMASGSNSQPGGGRKSSVTNALVHSSIFSGLSILPESEKSPLMSEQEGHPIRTNRQERTSQTRRLNFLSKSVAGSASTVRQASIDSDGLSPMSGDSHRSLMLQNRDSSASFSTTETGYVSLYKIILLC